MKMVKRNVDQGGARPCPEKRLQLLRELRQREHDLLIQRTNVFLLFHTILMTGAALGSNGPHIIVWVIPILGMIASLIWGYMGYRNTRAETYFTARVRACENLLPVDDRVFSNFDDHRGSGFRVLTSSDWFAYIFPALWFIAWFVILAVR